MPTEMEQINEDAMNQIKQLEGPQQVDRATAAKRTAEMYIYHSLMVQELHERLSSLLPGPETQVIVPDAGLYVVQCGGGKINILRKHVPPAADQHPHGSTDESKLSG